MSEQTKIEWADGTFNPWIGCTKVSPGCAHCYAENTTRARVLRSQGKETWGKGATRSRTSAATWRQPVKWNGFTRMEFEHRFRVFPSLCDWLDDEVPVEWLSDFLRLIYETPNLDWLLLTKRPKNFFKRMTDVLQSLESMRMDAGFGEAVSMTEDQCDNLFEFVKGWADNTKIPANVWFGVSVEDQQRADERIPALLKIPARVRFLSVEPMLGQIDLDSLLPSVQDVQSAYRGEIPTWPHIHWAIFGGESGPGARACNVEWIRSGVRQCQTVGVKAFVKQLGANPTMNGVAYAAAIPVGIECEHGSDVCPECDSKDKPLYPPLKDKKGGDMAEWPEDLRVREFPNIEKASC